MSRRQAVSRKPRDDARRTPRLRHVALAGLLLLLVAGAALLPGWLTSLKGAQFSELVVRGRLLHVTPEAVHAAARPYLAAGFMAVDMEALQHAVEALPWVAQTRLRREWPGKLFITVIEEQPVAVWQGRALLNGQGRVFSQEVGAYAGQLPDLRGPDGTQLLMLQAYTDMQQQLAVARAPLARLILSERRAWRLVLADGAEVRLGRQDAETRLQRFVRIALPVLRPQLEHVRYVDMRYTNGFAVGFKQPAGTTGV